MYRIIKRVENELKIPLRILLLISVICHIVSVYFNVGFSSPDEHYQIIEYADYKLGITPIDNLHWEFHSKIRPAVQPAIAFVIFKISDKIGLDNPFIKSFILRFLSFLISFFTTLLIAYYFLDKISTIRLKKWLIYLSLFLWFLPYLNARFSSENWSGSFVFAGIILCLILIEKNYISKNLIFIISGLLIGFGFWIRFQIGFSIFGFAVWALVFKKFNIKEIVFILCGFIFAVMICIWIDYWFYGQFVFTPYQYFYANIIEDKASGFGVNPWWYYFPEFVNRVVPPLSILLFLVILISLIRYPKNVFVWLLIPFLLGHILVSHKEFRFLYPVVFLLPVLVAISVDDIKSVKYWSIRKKIKGWIEKSIILMLVVENCILLAVVIFIPSHETVIFFEHLYYFNNNKKTEIFYSELNPYYNNLGKPNFYINKNIKFTKLNSFKELDSIFKNNNGEIYYFINSIEKPDTLKYMNINSEIVFANIPKWLYKFNLFGWQERSHIWTLYKLKSNNK